MNRQLGRMATQETSLNQYASESVGAWAKAYRIFNVNNSTGPSAYFGAAGTNTTLERAYISIANGTAAPGDAATTAISLLANGNVGIGTISPAVALHVVGSAAVTTSLGIATTSPLGVADILATSEALNLALHQYSNSAGSGGIIIARRARGSVGSEADLLSGDGLFLIGGRGWANGAFTSSSRATIRANTTENWTSTAQGTSIRLSTTANGTTTLTERVRIDHNGYVGIGTDTPGAELHVNSTRTQDNIMRVFHGTVTSGQAVYSAFGEALASGRSLLFGLGRLSPSGTAYGFIETYGGGSALALQSAGGNVGVGTTTPGALLEVFNDSNSGMVALTRDAGNLRGRLIFGRHNAGTLQNVAYIEGIANDGGAATNGYMRFTATNSAGTIRTALAAWGNTAGVAIGNTYAGTPSTYTPPSNGLIVEGYTGIGTSSPARLLHVATGNNTLPTLIGGELMLFDAGASVANTDAFFNFLSSRNQGLRFGDAADSDAGYLAYGHFTDIMEFGVGGATRMLLNSTGLGVQNTDAGYALDVTGRSRFRSGGGTAGLWFSDASKNDRAFIGLYSDGASPSWGAYLGGAWRMVQLSTGYLGVGTEVPGSLLHIKGASPEDRLESSSSNQDSAASIYDNGTLKGRVMYKGTASAGSKWYGLANDAADYLGIYSDAQKFYDLAGTNLYFWGFLSSGTPNVSILSNALRVNGTSVIVGGSTVVHKFTVYSGNIGPGTDNANSCGTSGARWTAIYAVNGTIQTSDARTKTDVVDSPLGLDFINALRPVAYKWKIGGRREIPKGNGEIKVVDVPGKRTHYGLIAQEVKAALPDGLDFGGWALEDVNDPDSGQALAYHQFIAPLIKAVQELAGKVKDLEKRLN